jgi:hypothetical protein
MYCCCSSQAQRLLLRQPALCVDGIPLLSRFLLGVRATPSSGFSATTGGSIGKQQQQQHSSSQERVWMLQLLWLGLRGPEDAKLYRRQYVLELLMALAGSLSSTAAAAGGAYDRQQWGLGLGLGLVRVGDNEGGLDVWIGRVVAQATLLPGAAAHAVASSGLVPWLAAVASQSISSSSKGMVSSSSSSSWEWAMKSLLQLVGQGIGLRLKAQAAGVYEGYLVAVARLVRAMLAVAGPGGAAAAHGAGSWTLPLTARRSMGVDAANVHYKQLSMLLELLRVMVAVAPSSSSSRRELEQHLLGPGLVTNLRCCCRAVALAVGERGEDSATSLEQELSQLLLMTGFNSMPADWTFARRST